MNPKSLEELKKYLNTMNAEVGVSKQEHARSYSLLIAALKEVRAFYEEKDAEIKNECKGMMEECMEDIEELEKGLNDISLYLDNKSSQDIVKAIKPLEANIRSIENTLVKMDSIQSDIERVRQSIPKLPEEIKAEQIRDKLETLDGDDRLDKSAIKGLKEELEELRSMIKSSGGRPAILSPRRNVISKYDLTSQCNGILKAFNLPIGTMGVLGVFGTQFPVQFSPDNDWTFSGRTLTLGASVGAPETGQTLWALIETLN